MSSYDHTIGTPRKPLFENQEDSSERTKSFLDRIFFIASTPADDSKIDLFVQSHGPSFINNWIPVRHYRASVAPTLSFDASLATHSMFFMNAPPVASLLSLAVNDANS
jgi:hypothetical protein